MKIVIDIPEETKEFIDNTSFVDYETNIFDPTLIITDKKKTITILDMLDAIRNCTPLPKGHGKLINADDVKANHKRWTGYLDDDMITRLNIAVDKHIPTIIEADEED